MIDHVSNLSSQLRNGYKANLSFIKIKSSTQIIHLLDTLERGGYIQTYEYEVSENYNHGCVKIKLKYNGLEPAIKKIQSISTPGKRIYTTSKELLFKKNNFCSLIISSSKGILLDREARLLGIGGELLYSIE